MKSVRVSISLFQGVLFQVAQVDAILTGNLVSFFSSVVLVLLPLILVPLLLTQLLSFYGNNSVQEFL